jgi:enoyl-CoA hydratase/carnithine racemase
LADTQRLVELVGLPRAKELLYLGKKIDASTAASWALVTDVVEREALSTVTDALIAQVLSVSGYSISGTKHSLTYLCEANAQASDNKAALERLFDDAFHGEDFKEGAAAFTEKRPARFS